MKKRQSFFLYFALFLVVVFVLYPASVKILELYYEQKGHVMESREILSQVYTTGACLPVGHAILFMDRQNRFGYFYFVSKGYGNAEYVFGLYDHGLILKKGKFTKWKYFPWQRQTMSDFTVCLNNPNAPYFKWGENGVLAFGFEQIDRVSTVKLSDMQRDDFTTNKVEWIKVDKVYY